MMRPLVRSTVVIDYDDLTDVASAYLQGTQVAGVAPSPSDGNVILETDSNGLVVGLEMLGARTLCAEFWRSHPVRPCIFTQIAKLDAIIFGQNHGPPDPTAR